MLEITHEVQGEHFEHLSNDCFVHKINNDEVERFYALKINIHKLAYWIG